MLRATRSTPPPGADKPPANADGGEAGCHALLVIRAPVRPFGAKNRHSLSLPQTAAVDPKRSASNGEKVARPGWDSPFVRSPTRAEACGAVWSGAKLASRKSTNIGRLCIGFTMEARSMTTRRSLIAQLPAAAVAGSFALRTRAVFAADKSVTVGIHVPLTGSDTEQATLMKEGAMIAADDANAEGGVAGYKINVMVLDNGTATAGQYDPAQAATNARKMVADPNVVAAVGPQNSGSGKAMAPILSQGNLAIITPSSTNPDITDPKFAGQYRPAGKAIYFRTVTTDAFQGPNQANYFADTLKVKSVYVLDDSGAYGVGIADAFQHQAEKRGIKILGRDQLNPKEADYTTILTKIKSLNPDALYYGGVGQAGVKVVKQSYDVLPKLIKSGGDGMYSAEVLKGAGLSAAEGWYATIAA